MELSPCEELLPPQEESRQQPVRAARKAAVTFFAFTFYLLLVSMLTNDTAALVGIAEKPVLSAVSAACYPADTSDELSHR